MKKKQIPEIVETIDTTVLDELMGDRYGIYAKEVIQDRAIPDVRDGLKPVQRRILFSMFKTGNTIDKPTRKSARISGDVMGKYHPHGDASIYDALARMSQPWAIREPLIDFQGNNGSIDGDPPAAARYTEARLSSIAEELLRDLDEDTVDMELTYDDTALEPVVLPSRFPNLFVNGATGIAVGTATEIPPHNLEEMCNAVAFRIDHPDCTVEELMEIVKGPDFPTGGEIVDSESLRDIYRTGRGKCLVKGRYEIVEKKDGSSQIIVHEIPYQVNKSELVKEIDELRISRAVPAIEEVRDESDKEGLRIAIDVKGGAKAQTVVNYLMAKTKLSRNYSAHVLAISEGRPTTLSLPAYLDAYIQHQLEVVVRKSRSLLGKREKRLEVVEGLIRAVSILDEVVAVIKRSLDKADAKKNIMAEFGFTEPQSEAIVMMPLYRLARTDSELLMKEKDGLEKEISTLKLLLSSQARRETLIKKDLEKIVREHPSPRRTGFSEEAVVLDRNDKEDLILEETVYVALTRDGYLKRSSKNSFKGSRGYDGVKPGIKEGDSFVMLGSASTRDYLLAFTNRGNYVYLPVFEIKENRWNQEGFNLSTLVSTSAEEKIVAATFVERNSFRDDLYAVLLSKKGLIKRIALSSFPVVRRSKAMMAIKLLNGDEVVDVTFTSGDSTLLVASLEGMAVRYNENAIYVTNPRSSGMKAGNFRGQEMKAVISLYPGEKPSKALLLTDRGHLRVLDVESIPVTERLSKAKELYPTFKNDPNLLCMLRKAGSREAPYALECVLSDLSRIDLQVENLNLTPKELHAKKSDEVKSRLRIVSVDMESANRIDKSTKSFAPAEKVEPPALEAEDPAGNVESTSFEQISLLDDLGGDE